MTPPPTDHDAPHSHTDVHQWLRRIFELGQDAIVASLCLILLAVMVGALWTLGRIAFITYGRPSEVLSQVVLILVLVELFRTLIYYLRWHRVSVSLMLEVAIVSELREILLNPPTGVGYQVYGNAALLAILGILLLVDRWLSAKMATPGSLLGSRNNGGS